MQRRRLLKLTYMAVAALLALGFMPALSAAGEFPSKPVTVYVGYSPGGGTDVIARAVAGVAPEFLNNQPLIIINKTGAAGTIAANTVAKAKPDGYTLLVAGGSETTSVGHHRKLPYHPINDFDPVIRFVRMRIIINTRVDAPWKDLHEFVQYAKKNPGKYSFASAGFGSLYHSTMLVVAKKAGIKLKHVPYKGGAPGMAALMGGHVDIALSSPDEARALAEAKKIRSLALTSLERYPGYPEIPTLKELGYDIYLENMKGFVVPKGTPPERIKFLHDAFLKVYNHRAFVKLAKRLKLERAYLNPEDFRKELQRMYEQIGVTLGK